MKNLNLITHNVLRFAASASIAVAAIVSTAQAQVPQIVPVTEMVTLRSGNDAAGAPLSVGADDGNITQTFVANCTPDPTQDYNGALAGGPAKVIERNPSWVFPLSDGDARWIHAEHNPSAALGSGTPAGNVQYAHLFSLPSNMPLDASVTIELEFAADDLVGAVGFGDLSNQVLLPGFPAGDWASISTASLTGSASTFGLVPGSNALFFRTCDTGGHFSGLLYSVKVTVEYCIVELDLRSGVGEIPDDAMVDVVLLADSTSSMSAQIGQVQTDATTILTSLMGLTYDVQVGIADYKDFNNVDPYAFQLGQPITNDQAALNAAIFAWSASGGSDIPEGQLYALDQLMKDPSVNWRTGSLRIIVYFGDAVGHDPVCNAISGAGYDITEASVISDLDGFGDYGTNVIAVTSGTGLNNPVNSSFDYTGPCGFSTGPTGQADRITAASGGLVQTIGNPALVTTAILDAIDVVLAQQVVLPVGSLDPNVMCEPLPNMNAYTLLSSGGGNAPFRISPNSAWIAALPGGNAGWIHSSHSTNPLANGSGRPPGSVLYAHEFLLPDLPLNATVTLDLEWAADETLFGVSMNGDVLSAGGNLAIGGSLTSEFSFASNAQVTGSALAFGLNPLGSNSLYLSCLENYAGGGTPPGVCSGIMYIAKMTIAFNCCDYHGGGDIYETTCECIGEGVAPCNNDGGLEQGCANSTGAGSSLTASGLNPAVTLRADNLPLPQTIGLFFRGVNQVGPLPFGDGIRCVGGEIERLEVVITNTGEATHGPFFSPPGAFYQFWYRDILGPCGNGFNLSSAILIP